MEKKTYEILDIKKDKKEINKNIGLIGLGALVIAGGLLGTYAFGQSMYEQYNRELPKYPYFALHLKASLTAFSFLLAVGGVEIIIENIKKLHKNTKKYKENVKTLKLKE